jgi:dTDP-4-amino-4,6-dideoxygalactose transaminase
LQAALLLPQMNSLDEQNARRRASVAQLLDAIRDLTALVPLDMQSRGAPAYYKLAWRYEATVNNARERFLSAVRAEGVALDTGFRGFIGRSGARCRRFSDLSHSQAAAEQTVILHHPVLLEPAETIARVAKAMRKVIQRL